MGLTYLIRRPEQHSMYAIDKFWFALQKTDKWYLIIPPTVVQREDYSDIEKKVINYKEIMIDLDKKELLKKIEDYRNHQTKMRQMYQQQIQQYNSKIAKRNT
jgi:adenylate kinase